MATEHIGKPIPRVDGRVKVTGLATYAAEYDAVADLAHGSVVSSAVARGRIARIDAGAALALPGVLHVLTHENAPRVARFARSYRDEVAPNGSPFRPLHDAEVKYSAQPVALVVADTLELSRHAATLVRVDYERAPHETDLRAALGRARVPRMRKGLEPPRSRGDAPAAFAAAAARIDAEYWMPIEHHNPMETFAATVIVDEDGSLTVYDKTQGPQNVQRYLCSVFGLSKHDVRVRSPFVGGAFGSGLRPQYHVFLAVLAARALRRSVRVALTRQQMFSFGHRPATRQRVALGASPDGALAAVLHEATAETSRFEDFTENVVGWSGRVYACANVELAYRVADLDLYTPIDMRAPGAAWGMFALESALDELAAEIGMDPLEIRLKNHAERDPAEGKPYSSKELRACYRAGAERFGWDERVPAPRSTQRGDKLVGWGMATGAWDAWQEPASARAVLTLDGKLTVSSATADIGTGTYTIMTQIAAEALGLPLEDVTFKLGDSALPEAPVEGGSFTASSVGSAVLAVCNKVRATLVDLARRIPSSPLAALRAEDVTFADGQIRSKRDPAQVVALREAMRHAGVAVIDEHASAEPSARQDDYVRLAHSAVFAEVEVDADLGTVRVTRVVSAVAAGRILNPKTARSQIAGGVIWGIGMALQEASVLDHGLGRFVTRTFADYHVPVNADVGSIDVIFVEEDDRIVNPLGAKGLGEIGLVGVAAAIANAVFHATGKRVRDLPITPDKLL
jgi:xanthine dehydrogenase YagR molybdenum-binding subunit